MDSLKAYFVSDIHLTDDSGPRARAFLKLLSELDEDTTHFFLMGDVFDVWVADHQYFEKKYSAVVRALEGLARRGIQFHVLEGNHDFHMNPYWEKRGATVHTDPFDFSFGPWKLRLGHGDETNPADRLYGFLRGFFRAGLTRKAFFTLPGPFVGLIGEKWSGQSRKFDKPYVNERLKNLVREFVVGESHIRDFDFYICGHTHMEEDWKFESGGKSRRFVNLGTWLAHPRVFILTPSGSEWRRL